MIEHPDITRALQSGYPRSSSPACTGCGDEAGLYYHIGQEFLCSRCAAAQIEQIVEDMDLADLADLLGVELIDPSDLTF